MSQCTKCGTRFIGTAANPPPDGLCRYCEMDALKSRCRELENLLCRIHRDGGHYIQLHGIEKACCDADKLLVEQSIKFDIEQDKVAEIQSERDALQQQLETLTKERATLRAENDNYSKTMVRIANVFEVVTPLQLIALATNNEETTSDILIEKVIKPAIAERDSHLETLRKALERIEVVTNHRTFSCANLGSDPGNECPKCIARTAFQATEGSDSHAENNSTNQLDSNQAAR